MIRPSMKYPLCGTMLTVSQSAMVDGSYIAKMLLTRMGFNSMTKRILFFGPPSLRCFGFTDTYTDQGISQLQMLVSHIQQQDVIGQLIHILLGKLQLLIGL